MLERAAVVFYAAFAAVALVWVYLAERPSVFWLHRAPTLPELATSVAAAALFAAAVVLWSRWTVRRLKWAQDLDDWFAELLGPLSWSKACLLALLSGFAEEMLFRGAMQPTIGLGPATLLFALVHWPPRPALLPWTLSAGLLGLVFGLVTDYTGNIAFAVVAHFSINLFNLKAVGAAR